MLNKKNIIPGYIFKTFLLSAILVCSINLLSAPMEFFPIKLVQPDGDTIKVFLSGDEYYNWVHDEKNYTIVQDQNTGYYVYADLINDELVPTRFIVNKVEPGNIGLKIGLNIPGGKMLERRNRFLEMTPDDMGDAPSSGTINNLVIYIRFSGEPEFTETLVKYDTMFNSNLPNANSMYKYFMEASYNALSINSTFYPVPPGATVISYQDANLRGYFQPYSVTNTIGYTGGSSGTERRTREHTLLVNAVNYVSSQVSGSLNLDGDNDGRVDNVCFIVYGSPGAWADLLWPHRWALYSYTVNINGKRVYDYNFQLQTSLNSSGVGVLCHEMFHSLGAPDLYHYTSNGITPVGSWDIMQTNKNPPQHMSAYMKYRYGNWISSIPVISNGTYSLNPLTLSTGNCFRINSPNSATEYYVVEYRRKLGRFEGSLPGTGMLVYRINTAVDGQGNAQGPPDEVYVYRPGGTLTVNGTVNSANFSSDVGRTEINDATNPSPFLSDGNPGSIFISSIGSSGETINFTVGSIAAPDPITDLTTINPKSGSLTLQWTVPYSPSPGVAGYDIRYSTSPISNITGFNNAQQIPYTGTPGISGAVENFLVTGLNFNTLYYFSIRSSNIENNWSDISNSGYGTTLRAPQISITPLAVNSNLSPGETKTDTISISNITALSSTLDFNISLENNTFPDGSLKSFLLPHNKNFMKSLGDINKDIPQENYGVSFDGQGGPDLFGYEWIDSNDPNGPVYVWEDIAATGTEVTNWTATGTYDARDEGYAGPFSTGFNFDFYGILKTQVYVSSNGFLHFNPLTANTYTNASIPGTSAPNEYIAPFWDDLDGRTQGTVHYKQDGSRFILQFTNWQKYPATGSLTYQVILYSNGRIMFYYNNMSATLNSATVGIENSGGADGLQVAYNAAYAGNELAVKISSDPDWLSSNVNSGTIYNGNTVDIVLTFNSEDYPLGNYTMDLVISSNDPTNPAITIPVSMTIANEFNLNSFTTLIEGLYDGTTMVSDTVTVELRSTSSPYSLIDEAKIVLDNNGEGTGKFYSAENGTPYYLVLKHRNSIETWSSTSQTFTGNALSYDFTTASSQAYGNNMIMKNGKWCIYSGDVNQDGIVNSQDLNLVFNDNINGGEGYTASDLNGDLFTESSDLNLVFINNALGIVVVKP